MVEALNRVQDAMRQQAVHGETTMDRVVYAVLVHTLLVHLALVPFAFGQPTPAPRIAPAAGARLPKEMLHPALCDTPLSGDLHGLIDEATQPDDQAIAELVRRADRNQEPAAMDALVPYLISPIADIAEWVSEADYAAPDPQKAPAYLEEAGQRGYPPAHVVLATLWAKGELTGLRMAGLPQDKQQAFGTRVAASRDADEAVQSTQPGATAPSPRPAPQPAPQQSPPSVPANPAVESYLEKIRNENFKPRGVFTSPAWDKEVVSNPANAKIALPRVIELLQHSPKLAVRQNAIAGLTRIIKNHLDLAEPGIAALIDALADKERNGRYSAAIDLRYLIKFEGYPQAIAAAKNHRADLERRAANEQDDEVRTILSEVVGALGAAPAVPGPAAATAAPAASPAPNGDNMPPKNVPTYPLNLPFGSERWVAQQPGADTTPQLKQMLVGTWQSQKKDKMRGLQVNVVLVFHPNGTFNEFIDFAGGTAFPVQIWGTYDVQAVDLIVGQVLLQPTGIQPEAQCDIWSGKCQPFRLQPSIISFLFNKPDNRLETPAAVFRRRQ